MHMYVHGCECLRLEMPRSSKHRDANNHVVDLVYTKKIQHPDTLGFGLVLIHITYYGNELIVWVFFC